MVKTITGDSLALKDVNINEIICDTFNFSVKKYHNYFVGKTAILAHNQSKFADTTQRLSTVYVIRDDAGLVIYIGQTIQGGGNPEIRFRQHVQNGRFDALLAEYGLENNRQGIDELRDLVDIQRLVRGQSLTNFELSVWEQHYMNQYGAVNPNRKPRFNRIRAISEQKYNRYWELHNPCR